MAKGDHDAAMGAIQNQNKWAQTQYGNLQNQFQTQLGKFQGQQSDFLSNFQNAIAGLNRYTGGNVPGSPTSGAGGVNTATTQAKVNTPSFSGMGGGWDQNQDPMAGLLAQAMSQGLKGQDAVDFVNKNTPGGSSGIEYYADSGNFGGQGWYAAPNAQNGGALDLIQRGGGSNVFGINLDPGADTRAGYSALAQGLGPDFWNKVNPYFTNLNDAISHYQNFANTGGFSDADKQNMIAAAIAPTRQTYSNLTDELSRQANLAGGNLGNIGVATSNLGTQAASQIGAQNVNAQSALAQLVQQGKEYGTTGEAQASLAGAQAQTAIQQLDAQMREAGLGGLSADDQMALMAQIQSAQLSNTDRLAQLASLGGLAQMGNADVMGQQGMLAGLLNSWNASNLGSINAQLGASQIPGDFQSFMGNLGSIFGLGGDIASMFGGGGGGFGNLSSLFGGGNPYGSGLDYGQTQWPSLYGGGSSGDQGPYAST